MLLEEYIDENTKIKIYDDCFAENFDIQKKYIDNVVLTLLQKQGSIMQ